MLKSPVFETCGGHRWRLYLNIRTHDRATLSIPARNRYSCDLYLEAVPNDALGEDILNFKKLVRFMLTFQDPNLSGPDQKGTSPDMHYSTKIFDCRMYEWGFTNFPSKSDLNTRKNILKNLFVHA